MDLSLDVTFRGLPDLQETTLLIRWEVIPTVSKAVDANAKECF